MIIQQSLRTRGAISYLAIFAGCPLLIALIGYADFRQGDENSMLLFYLIPIALATWYSGTAAGFVAVILSVAAAVASDRMAGIPKVDMWNVATSVIYYVVFVALLSRWHNSVRDMHARVEERTAELQHEIAVRRELEQEVANVTEHERARLGRELHDSLCQHLTGTALKAETLVKQMQREESTATTSAREVVSLVNRGTQIARDIAKGLFSPELEGEGLIVALQGLAQTTSQDYEIDCSFVHDWETAVSPSKATQLYWIAREAVTNAVRHGNPKRIRIILTQKGKDLELNVTDDGCGLSPGRSDSHGLGLQVMKQRAELADGFLQASECNGGGTTVRCLIPVVT